MQQQQKEALFNSALGAVIRLNRLLDNCGVAAETLNANMWYHNLRGVQRECWSKLNEKARKYTDDKLKKLRMRLFTYQKKSENRRMHNKTIILGADFYDELDSLEKYLRLEADKAELLIPNKKTMMDMLKEFEE